ncbi:4Fe-4S dicluster domain-containing protein [Verrucomicrobiaceae bacterium N1E253]|uniref:4Fe-4S dicluster domain-containing protein n=1 Tax=Oceaniferula marina TaxID=2748318 RepID=A0A851GKQ8_9BACT|nr:4Fe-4S dicluster domain-containing protein [Oceaniferula marina]NWK56421.1 4Fe-4S dicluster domain-containing protein [Oceaniferula marina]
MTNQFADQVRDAGVVGAGGGGFPAHVKLAASADTVIVNGAECEPLLHKDAAMMEQRADELVRGLLLVVEAVGAKEAVIGIKEKNAEAVKACEAACEGTMARVHLLGDFYPAGDEFDLVYEVTGKLIPAAGLPKDVGCLVSNVESLINMALAVDGKPVIRKTLTIAGAVAEPFTAEVPVGVSYRDLIAMAGGVTVPDPVLMHGGMMMGRLGEDLDEPVTKTSSGIIVLDRTHPIMVRKMQPLKYMDAIGKSACDQCRYCTELCPRYLLGYDIEPHQVMRSLSFTSSGDERYSEWAALCCACGLCTLFACPEALFPKEACDSAKDRLREKGFQWTGASPTEPHPMREGRKTPTKRLMAKLDILEYDRPAPVRTVDFVPKQLVLPLKQHAGAPAEAKVSVGQKVSEGELIAAPAPKNLGAIIHAPLAGVIEAVSDSSLVLSVG